MLQGGERYAKRVGTVVDGRWRVDSLLGWGSTSAVYAATHRNGHRAALKILHQSLCSDAVVIERFLREAGIANAIKHRAVVPIRDDGMTEEGCAYLVVELLDGDTLDAVRERKKGRIELEELAPIAEELMSAIAAVHAAGVVHRDLKPQNVFITKAGELKLLDFGTARIFDRTAGSPVSAAGMVIGTPAFMSPEQARGARAEVDAQSDVWSLGAMLFTILSGEYVHDGRDAHARLLAAASRPARKLGDIAPSVDDRIATVIDRALAYAKEDRWPDVQSMRVAFREAVLAAVPTMRDLEAFRDVAGDDDESAAGTVSMSDPTLVTAAVARDTTDGIPTPMASVVALNVPPEATSAAELLGVSSTQGVRRVKAGIPIPALVVGFGAMAAVVLLVVFFKAGSDAPSARSAAAPVDPLVTAPAPPDQGAAPAPSFIVIEAPDEPVPAKKTESLPARAAAPVAPARAPAATETATTTTTGSAEGGAGGGPTTDEPDPKGGAAPGAAPLELP